MIHEYASRYIAIGIISAVKLLVHITQVLDHLAGCARHAPIGLHREVREEVV